MLYPEWYITQRHPENVSQVEWIWYKIHMVVLDIRRLLYDIIPITTDYEWLIIKFAVILLIFSILVIFQFILKFIIYPKLCLRHKYNKLDLCLKHNLLYDYLLDLVNLLRNDSNKSSLDVIRLYLRFLYSLKQFWIINISVRKATGGSITKSSLQSIKSNKLFWTKFWAKNIAIFSCITYFIRSCGQFSNANFITIAFFEEHNEWLWKLENNFILHLWRILFKNYCSISAIVINYLGIDEKVVFILMLGIIVLFLVLIYILINFVSSIIYYSVLDVSSSSPTNNELYENILNNLLMMKNKNARLNNADLYVLFKAVASNMRVLVYRTIKLRIYRSIYRLLWGKP